MTLKLEDGREQGLLVGVDNSFDNTLYVKKAGDATVRIVDAYAKSNFDRSAFELRDKRVAHLDDSAEVKRVEVSGVNSPYTLIKEGAAWKVGGQAADSSAADGVIRSLKNLRATSVAAENSNNLKDFGLDKPKIVARLDARTVMIGQAKKPGSATLNTYAKRDDSPVVYEVDQQILKDLEKQPFDLQDKQLVHADREAVRELVFEGPSGVVRIARKKDAPPDGGFADETFMVTAPSAGAAKKWKISSALYSITGLRAAAFDGPIPKDLAKYGLDKPKTATLMGDGGKILARIRLGAEKDGKRYVLADGLDKLARVEKATVDDWPWTAADALETPATPQAAK